MPLTEAQRKANDKHLKAHYTQFAIRYRTEFVQAIRDAAKAADMSFAGYIHAAIEAFMHSDQHDKEEDA